jgi:DNA polymerase I-like protein with 3'-5' exonuclease and polymerase domains
MAFSASSTGVVIEWKTSSKESSATGELPLDWTQYRDCELWSHNRMFDGMYFPAYGIQDPGGNCTANLSRYLCGAHSLVDAARILLGEDVSKEIRTEMKGVQFHDLSPERQQQMRNYALRDAELCYRLSLLRDQWPAWEQRLSLSTLRMGARGIRIDQKYLDECIVRAKSIVAAATEIVPWAHEVDAKGKPIALNSRTRKLAYLAELGVPAPKSFDYSKAEFRNWLNKYGDQFPFVAALRDIVRSNQKLKKLEHFKRRIDENTGRMPYDIVYMGVSHTGRWAGSTYDGKGEKESGTNMQNLDNNSYEGIALRRLIIPDDDKVLISCDLSAIEPRVLAFFAGDEKILAALRQGFNVYEAAAKVWGFWNGDAGTLKKSDPTLYKKMKQFFLGCGYGMGWAKLKQNIEDKLGEVITEKDAKELIATYKRYNPLVVKFWNRLQALLTDTFHNRKDRTLSLTLPSGRKLRYENIHSVEVASRPWSLNLRGYVGGEERNLYGGSLCENVVQSSARDIFGAAFLRLEEAGYTVIMTTHDEAVVEAPIATDPRKIEAIMTEESEWFPDLALGAEAPKEPLKFYGDAEEVTPENDCVLRYRNLKAA